MNPQIGTSGFSYDDWKGTFYPERMDKSGMLAFYCSVFNTVEVNVTYYTIPGYSAFEKMNAKTPDNFEFVVKVNQETTHRRKENRKSIAQLLESIKPLQESSKLGGLLAQFPYSFKNNEQNRKYILQTREYVNDVPFFVEFRNDGWDKDALSGFLKANDIGYVNVDEPALDGLIPQQDWLTNKTGYVRFHGRNKKMWWDGQGSQRYDYAYSSDELQEWLIRISDILKKSYKAYIFFNNHPKGNAPQNAQTLTTLINQYISL